MSKERVPVYCDDCPTRHYCESPRSTCEGARGIARMVAEAPPLTPEQVTKIAAILLSAPARIGPAGTGKGRSNRRNPRG